MKMDKTEERIIEIDPDGKYILTTTEILRQADLERLSAEIQKWLNRPKDPILILSGNIKLTKVDKDE
jgi:biopolymer transport protein ExbD